jgi:RNA polymerase sigma-70 factor (ECF subfamily)
VTAAAVATGRPVRWRPAGAGLWVRIAAVLAHQAAAASGCTDRPSPAREAATPEAAAGPPPGSFREVALPHLDAAYNLARFLTRDADAADDVVQEAFLRAFRAFGTYRGGDARAWLLAIVRNCARNWASARVRDRARHAPLECGVPPDERPAPGSHEQEIWDPDQPTPEASLVRDSEAAFIRRLIEALPEEFREVLILREFDDLSYKQIAAVTAAPIGTVMSRLARARHMLATAWRRRCGEDRP